MEIQFGGKIHEVNGGFSMIFQGFSTFHDSRLYNCDVNICELIDFTSIGLRWLVVNNSAAQENNPNEREFDVEPCPVRIHRWSEMSTSHGFVVFGDASKPYEIAIFKVE